MSGTIKSDIDGKVCTLTIENTGKRNAIGYSMMDEMKKKLASLEEKDREYVVVITGNGDKAFSAGFNLDQAGSRFDRSEKETKSWPEMIDKIDTYDYPTIAMINGYTYGGAMEIIAACDLRVGVEDAEFGITPAKLGSVYSGKAIHRVMNIVGPAYTKEFLFTGEPMSAQRADEIGLLNHITTEDNLEEITYEIANNISDNAPLSLKYMKTICDIIEKKTWLSETEHKWVTRVRDEAYRSEDHKNAVEAFSEDREPEFKGK